MKKHGRAACVVAGVALLVGLVSGCTASGPQPSPTPTTRQQSVRGLPAGVIPSTSIPTEVANDADARKNVETTGCAKVSHGWKATGVARNPGKSATTYTVVVFFTTDTATVIDTARTTVTVRPHGTAKWTAAQTFTAPQRTLCVLRGVTQR